MIGADAELTIRAVFVVIGDELTIDELLTGLTECLTVLDNRLLTDDGLDAVLLIDELTECLTDELTKRLTVEGLGSKLTECLTVELTVFLTVDGLELVTGELN